LPLLAVVGLLGYFLLRRPADDVSRARLSEPAIPLPTVDLGAFVPRNLPGGVTLNVPANGVESKLVAFIEDPSRPVAKDLWFNFDRLEFETGSAQLRPTSQEQLRNVAEILKAYPNVKVKIGGYTDNVGDDASNLKLSEERAVNTMNAIANLGIDRTRLEAEGYGEQFPVADNAVEEGRQRNRRIDIRVTQK
jgi:outer membrane protein OmpA-like peptidoglycan-associated protein